MDPIAAGFWGAFFGTAVLMLAISLAAFFSSHRRVALMAGLSALMSAAFVAAFLGWLPLEVRAEGRLLAHVAVLAAVTLALMLLALLGLMRFSPARRRITGGLAALGAAAIALGWVAEPQEALALGCVFALGLGLAMGAVALRRALGGDRLAWVAVSGVLLMLVALTGLSWIALRGTAPWPVHALSAVSGMAYLAVMGGALWKRYAYLLDLAEVMAHGPSYDPVTRMRSHTETGQMLGELFFQDEAEARLVGVIAICIGNLYALENLHGRAAFNHALFITAGRLRRCVPATVEMGRLGDDGFLLVARSPSDVHRLDEVGRLVRAHLSRPVAVSTSREPAHLESARTAWAADVGIGVLTTSTQARPAQVVSTARAMARTAWSYASRLAGFDQQSGRISELAAEARAAAIA